MCLFCKIANHEIPAKILFENDELCAFHDIHPGAPTHVLVIPKRHVTSLTDMKPEDKELLGALLLAAIDVAERTGIKESGFRTVVNTGPNAGQSVFHVHVHVLGGRAMAWPPG